MLLGPKIATAKDDKTPLVEEFSLQLSSILKEEEVPFDKKHERNLTYMMQRYMKVENYTPSDSGFEAKNFYEKHEGLSNEVQKMLAKLPLGLVINTSPDDTMVNALKQEGKYKTLLEWYNYDSEATNDIEPPSAEQPLVYNLFGYYKDPDSLVLTESDQVKFISKVVKDQPSIPPKLLRQFQGKKTFLFLGFDWEQWNLRLLLQCLNLEKESNIMAHSRHNDALEPRTKEFYENHFRFSFVTDDISDFVTELQKKYLEHAQPTSSQKKVLIVSEPQDEASRDELYTNLKSLQVDCWHEGLTMTSREKESEFQKHLEEADLILLLITTDFLVSNNLTKTILPKIVEKHNANTSTVIPIIAKSCQWDRFGELTRMPIILPKLDNEVGKPINSFEKIDEAYNNILSELQKVLS